MQKKNVENIYRLSPQQQGMLYESLYGTGSGIHIDQFVCSLKGELEPDLFARAWQRTLELHSILRTAFVWKEQDEPLQVVLREVEMPIEGLDFKDLDAASQEERVAAYLIQDRRRGFDLARPPLMRVVLFHLGKGHHRLLWTTHHILMDGWCRPLLLKDLFHAYGAMVRGETLRLEASRPYRDYVVWLEGRDLAATESFWRRELRGFTQPTALGREEPAADPAVCEERYGDQTLELAGEPTRRLQAFLRSRRLTTNSLIQGLWALLLSRFSGCDDVVFGTTVSGRPPELKGVESMVGLFINTLPLRLSLQPELPFATWLDEVQRRHVNARDHGYCSEGQIHRWSPMKASEALYESILVFENYPVDAGGVSTPTLRLDLGEASFKGAFTKYALTVLAIEGRALRLRLVYDRLRLEETSVAWIAEHALHVLERIAQDPHNRLEELRRDIPEDRVPLLRARPRRQRRDSNERGLPRNEIEERLVRLWTEVLDVEVGVHDNFFDLGGHSLLAGEILTRVRQTFDVDMTLRDVFEAPTVSELGLRLAQNKAEQVDPEELAHLLNELESQPETGTGVE